MGKVAEIGADHLGCLCWRGVGTTKVGNRLRRRSRNPRNLRLCASSTPRLASIELSFLFLPSPFSFVKRTRSNHLPPLSSRLLFRSLQQRLLLPVHPRPFQTLHLPEIPPFHLPSHLHLLPSLPLLLLPQRSLLRPLPNHRILSSRIRLSLLPRSSRRRCAHLRRFRQVRMV